MKIKFEDLEKDKFYRPNKKKIEEENNRANKVEETKVEQSKQSIWDQIKNIANGGGYVAKRTGAGVVGGLAGLGQSVVTDTANQLRKGEENKSVGENINSILSVISPAYAVTKNSYNTIKEGKENVKGLFDKNKTPFEAVSDYITNAVSSGVNSSVGKMAINNALQLVGKADNNLDEKALQLNEKISNPVEDMNLKLQEEGQEYGKVTNTLGNVGQAVGNMVPAIAGTVATSNPGVGLATMGLSSKGQSTEEALKKGVDLDKAVKIGDTKGMIEVGTEMLTGGINIFGKGALDEILEKGIVDNVKNNVAKFFVKQGVNVGGEVLEETISDLLGTVIDKGTVDPNASYSLKDWGKTALETTITTFVLNALTGGLVGDIKGIKQENQSNQEANEWINKAQEIINQNQSENVQENEKTIEGNKDITQEVKLPLKRFTRVRDINNNLTTNQNQNKSFEDVVFDAMDNYESNEVETPLKDRNINTIGKETKRNAYQYENPNVKPYFQEMAQMIGEDLSYISSPDNRSSKKGGGTKLSVTTKAMDILHDEQGYSYDQIAKGLENIIEDNGKENNAISKKLELIIDDQLRNGYTNALGKNIEPNQEYINTIQQGQEIQESQENQQIQEVQLPIKEKKKIRLPIKQEANINQEQNQVKAKDTNEVMNKVQKYIKNNDLDMTTNEFVEWASNVELENEENMTQEQKELYSLISDIQNRASMEENIANNQEKVYNNANESESDINENSRRTQQNDKRRVQELLEKYTRGEETTGTGEKNIFGEQKREYNVTQNEVKTELIEYAKKYPKKQLNENEKKLKSIINNLNGDVIFYEFGNNNINQGLCDTNVFYIDTLGEEKIENVFYHEMTHFLRQNNNTIYTKEIQPIVNEIATNFDNQEYIYKYAISNEDFDINKLNGTRQLELAEEVVADNVANMYGDLEIDYQLPENIRNQIKNSMDKIFSTSKNSKESSFSFNITQDNQKNVAENEIQRKINRSMTMKEAEDMIQRAFVTGKIYDWYDGKYKNGNEWLQGEGAEDVSMWIENDYNLQQKYINSNEEILNEEYTIDDVIEAYQNKTLTGNEKKQTQRLDTSKDTGYKDKRFFAPREATGGKELYDLANQRVTNNNRNEVYKARADFIINAHNEGYVNELGLTQKEVNEKLRKWANYPLKARNISGYINKGVATENKWVGIENSSIVNKLSVSTEQLDSLVKEVKGTSDDYQRKYIVDTMLALDTHLDYKGLTYDFAPDVEGMGESALADYSSKNDTIRVKRDGLNTIAHETGHYIDHLLGREIGNGYDLGLTSLCREYSNKNLSEQQKQFLSNFNNFLNSIEDVSDIGSTYKMSSNEVFARFVARFVEWTRNTATGNRYGYEAKWYNDNFIQPQYVEFAKLLQEYSLLKTTNQVSDKRIKSDNRIYEQRISDIYEELNKKKKTKVNFDNEIMKINSEIKGNSETDEKIAKILTEPQKNVKPEQRTWAVLKANLIDKGAVFEKLSQQTKNRDLQGKYDFTLSAGSRGQNAIGNARYEFDSKSKTKKQISKSLTDIIDEVGDNTEDFYNYMYHQLNVDRMTLEDRFDGDTGTNYERTKKVENKPVFGKGVTAEISEKVVKNLESKHPEFKKYAKDVYDYLDANTKELVDNGVISKETQELFKEMYPHYVPISRVIYNNQAIGVPLDTNRTGVNSPIKKATGGHTDINPLFQTMADRTLQTYTASARNSFGVELKNTLAKLNQLNTNTEVADIDSIMDSMTQEEQNNELLQKGKNGENPTFTVFENGNKITYEISQDMYDALKPKNELLKKLDNTKVSEVAKKISNFRRGVLTEYNPIFSITNAVKDAQDVLINSQHSAKTYSKFPEAYAQIMKKGYWYNEYVQNGGEQNSYFTEGEFENLKKKSTAKNILTFPLKKISDINNVIEMAPRLAEYIASREKGASVESAMLDASRVTTNFKAGGDLTKFANRNGATFLNASVQGFQQQVRNIQEANMKGLKGWTSLATKYTIAGLPVLLLNNLFWDDDDDYNQLQDYVKDNYYVVAKLPNGNFLRVPKGRMVATIQKVVSNVNDFVKEGNMNPDSVASTIWKDLKEDITFGMDNLAPNNPVKNNILSPIFDVINNKTWYGGDMIPSRLKDVPEAEQYDESTDKLSKWIGEKTGKSPIKINYLLDQYSGGLGDVLLPMGTPQAENNVFEDKFTTNPTMKSQYPTDFFTKADELKIKNNSAKVTDEDQLKYKFFSNVQKDVSDLYKQKREIQLSDKTDEEKKKELNTIQKQINKLAKEGLEKVDKLKISGNYATVGEKEYYKVNGKWNELNEKDKIDGISLKTYSDYQNSLQKEKENLIKSGELEEGKSLTDNQKNKVLLDSNYTKKEKQAIYSNTTGKNDDLYNNLSKLTDVNIDAYLDFKTQDIKGEEDTSSEIAGKTKSGSKKKNFVEYLNNANFSRVERLYIYGKNFKYTQSERDIMEKYINESNLNSTDKKAVYEGLTKNVEKHKDGKYYWKK